MVSYSSWQREGCKTEYPGVAKFGIALEWGSRGRWFESSHSDHRSILRDAPIFLLLKGLRVIPTVNWGDESTFDFCFEGIESSFHREDLDAFKIAGTSSNNRGTIEPYLIEKGGGSAYGGGWKPSPNKPDDQRFLGELGEIKTTYKNGYCVDTKIGSDGRAALERHYTDHKQPWAHTNPHDHPINWDNPAGFPDPQPPINYPDGAPEFKSFERRFYMKNTIVPSNSLEQNRFTTISDFQTCMRWHGEVEFLWNGVHYSITHRNGRIYISHSGIQETERSFATSGDILAYDVGSYQLRDIITKVTVVFRSV